MFFSFALIFQLVLKIMFNVCAKHKIPLDKWTVLDSISAVLNIVAVMVISRLEAEVFLDDTSKQSLDYFMILVLATSWLRFFFYFLVVRAISKLLLTLIEMVGDTISFILIVVCFILIMASVFTTLYQDTN